MGMLRSWRLKSTIVSNFSFLFIYFVTCISFRLLSYLVSSFLAFSHFISRESLRLSRICSRARLKKVSVPFTLCGFPQKNPSRHFEIYIAREKRNIIQLILQATTLPRSSFTPNLNSVPPRVVLSPRFHRILARYARSRAYEISSGFLRGKHDKLVIRSRMAWIRFLSSFFFRVLAHGIPLPCNFIFQRRSPRPFSHLISGGRDLETYAHLHKLLERHTKLRNA